MAARLLKKGKAIDVLVNNAGALVNPRDETAEGLEKSFALLLLSPYLLAERLHPLLKKAASQHGVARVVNVLSGGMYTQRIHVDDLQRSKAPTPVQSPMRGQARPDDPDRGVGASLGQGRHRGQRHAPRLGRDAGRGDVAAGVPPGHEAGVAHSARGCRHHRLAGGSHGGRPGSGEFWLDRQPHAKHVFPGTRESPAERREFLKALAGFV